MSLFSRTWSKLSKEQRKVWTVVSGAIVLGSVFKVAYFSFSRNLMVSDHQRKQEEGLERLREAGEFAEWSRKDRESRVPPLTAEEREQLRDYLRLVERHGMHMVAARHDISVHSRHRSGNDLEGSSSSGDNGLGCPVSSHHTTKKPGTSEPVPAST